MLSMKVDYLKRQVLPLVTDRRSLSSMSGIHVPETPQNTSND